MKPILITLALLLTACEKIDPDVSQVTANTRQYNVVCINGVKYYQQSAYASLAPVYNKSTLQVETCQI